MRSTPSGTQGQIFEAVEKNRGQQLPSQCVIARTTWAVRLNEKDMLKGSTLFNLPSRELMNH
ncbi:hypothetical protein [Planctopirus limnophila]|uniref:hypothetical protein n=1 Tax=Planctopirus limnophila TaxID=120 RepID=UPI00031EC32D|nr:hypothetical protein [Planctopirus limnophila]